MDGLRSVDKTRRVGQDSSVPRIPEQDRRVAHLHLHAQFNKHVSLAERLNEARLCFDEMRILRTLRKHGDADLIATNLLRQAA